MANRDSYFKAGYSTSNMSSDSYIKAIDNSPVSSFVVNGTYTINSTLTFTDTSTNNPTSWLWDFGDGNTSTAQNPTHTYNNAPSTVTVGMTASNQFGSSYSEVTLVDDVTLTSMFVIGGSTAQYLYKIRYDGAVQNTVSIPNNSQQVIMNPDYDEIIVLEDGGNTVQSYDYGPNPTTTFTATIATGGLKMKVFGGEVYISTNNSVLRYSTTGTLIDTYNFDVENSSDFWVYDGYVYLAGTIDATSNRSVDKVSLSTGNHDSTFRSNRPIGDNTNAMGDILVDNNAVYVSGDFTSFGSVGSVQGNIFALNHDGTLITKNDTSTVYVFGLTNYAFGLHFIIRAGSSSAIRTIQSVNDSSPLTKDTSRINLEYFGNGGVVEDFRINEVTNEAWVVGGFGNYNGTVVDKIVKFKNGSIDTSFNLSGGIGSPNNYTIRSIAKIGIG